MDNVARFPRFKLTDVVASLRTLADAIEAGERSCRRVVVVIEQEDGGSDYCAIGDDFPKYHALGMLTVCANNIQGLFDEA